MTGKLAVAAAGGLPQLFRQPQQNIASDVWMLDCSLGNTFFNSWRKKVNTGAIWQTKNCELVPLAGTRAAGPTGQLMGAALSSAAGGHVRTNLN